MRRALERRRAGDEEGFTLVELVVSLMLITLVLSSFLMVTLQAVAGGRIADARTKANQILTERLELLRGGEIGPAHLHRPTKKKAKTA